MAITHFAHFAHPRILRDTGFFKIRHIEFFANFRSLKNPLFSFSFSKNFFFQKFSRKGMARGSYGAFAVRNRHIQRGHMANMHSGGMSKFPVTRKTSKISYRLSFRLEVSSGTWLEIPGTAAGYTGLPYGASPRTMGTYAHMRNVGCDKMSHGQPSRPVPQYPRLPQWRGDLFFENGKTTMNDEAHVRVDDNAFADTFQTFRDAFAAINSVTYDDAHSAMCEAASDVRISPDLFGAMLMQYLPRPDERISYETRAFWMAVADSIGPDFIGEMKRAADFMNAVDDFA